MATARCTGKMAVYTKALGRMDYNTGKASFIWQMEESRKEFSRKTSLLGKQSFNCLHPSQKTLNPNITTIKSLF